MIKKLNLNTVSKYYSNKFEIFGPTHKSADWSSKKVQYIRFNLLSKILKKPNKIILEIGCGTGEFINFLSKKKYNFLKYMGIDISKKIILFAKKKFKKKTIHFLCTHKFSGVYDYIIANGVFNVKLNNTNKIWKKFFFNTLDKINDCSKEGFAFNFLPEIKKNKKRKKYLFYVNKNIVIKYCKKFSKKILIIRNKNIIDLTIIVKK